ncbi:SRPBCC family protein [Nocardia australiensis]|uniref:SRPBCC family protein n=1 Tax=Nocardia australiensis TaxID=2887191 RepID=UPI001D13A24E|nr:SRPBCC family protein [Nocardia australiensis]
MKTATATATGIGIYLVGLAVGYQVILRDRCLNWGSGKDEVARTMPGDDLLTAPDIVATRSITIDTGPERIWPWLVQMGPGRGGAYTYDWIENLLGLSMHSADMILPEFQNLSVGDTFALGETGPRMRVAVLETERAVVFASADGHWVWAFGLYPSDEGTRLVSRNRITLPDAAAPTRLVKRLIMEPGSWVMERKMLLGIKQRAESDPSEKTPSSPRVAHRPHSTGDQGLEKRR